jgi:hypothetical protein
MYKFYSSILGFIIGIIIYRIVIYKKPYHGPNSNIVRNKIYLHNNKCYQYTPQINMCPINK